MHTQKTAHHPKTTLQRFSTPVFFGLAALLAGGALSAMPAEWEVTENVIGASVETTPEAKPDTKPLAAHVPTPDSLKAIYMSQCVSGTPTFRDSLVSFIDASELNAVVIDIKDYTGKIAFPTDNAILAHSVSDACGANDMKDFVQRLHDKGIYVIGRITVFQDPYYTKLHPEQAVQSKSRPGEPWKDHKGLSFIDVSSTGYWDYVVELSREAHDVVGFDELNYDYIRYPSDGPMADAVYQNPNKAEAVEKFFKYLAEHVKPTGAVMSADLFGYVTVLADDLGIGQQLERALPYFDYIAPMVYPSHYNKGFVGLANVNSDPYKVVNYSMVEAVKRAISAETSVRTLSGVPLMKTEVVPATATTPTTTQEVPSGLYSKEIYSALKLRPWLQDFDYGKDYQPEDIDAQIRATYDAGLTGYMFWDPANKYENLRKVLAPPSATP